MIMRENTRTRPADFLGSLLARYRGALRDNRGCGEQSPAGDPMKKQKKRRDVVIHCCAVHTWLASNYYLSLDK